MWHRRFDLISGMLSHLFSQIKSTMPLLVSLGTLCPILMMLLVGDPMRMVNSPSSRHMIWSLVRMNWIPLIWNGFGKLNATQDTNSSFGSYLANLSLQIFCLLKEGLLFTPTVFYVAKMMNLMIIVLEPVLFQSLSGAYVDLQYPFIPHILLISLLGSNPVPRQKLFPTSIFLLEQSSFTFSGIYG